MKNQVSTWVLVWLNKSKHRQKTAPTLLACLTLAMQEQCIMSFHKDFSRPLLEEVFPRAHLFNGVLYPSQWGTIDWVDTDYCSCSELAAQSFLWLILYSTFSTWEIPQHLAKQWASLMPMVMVPANTCGSPASRQPPPVASDSQLSRGTAGQATAVLSGLPGICNPEKMPRYLWGYPSTSG